MIDNEFVGNLIPEDVKELQKALPIERNFLADYTEEEYAELRRRYPEDGTEYTKWQAFPKVPEPRKTIILFNNEELDYQISFDEVVFRNDPYSNNGPMRSYLRGHYYFDVLAFDAHYWMYAPDEPPGNYGYNVGD